MNIGLDIRPLGSRGVGRYLAGLLEGMARTREDFRAVLFASDRSDLSQVPQDPRFEVQRLGKVHPALAEQWLIPRRARSMGLDVVHFPDNTGPIAPGMPMVLTLHDGMWRRPLAQALRWPTLRQRLQDAYRKWVCPRAAAAASAVITVSRFSARELSQALPIASKLHVVPNAVTDSFRRPLPPSAVRRELERLGLRRPFLLCSGAADRRKNISRLLRAFVRARLGEAELVVTSLRPGEIETTDYREAAAGARARFLGYVSEEQLKALYQSARGYVFPSLWEGFGLPVLEAFALGCPVLVARAGALPETAGEGALYADPHSEADLARGLRRLWNCDRRLWARRGRRELRRFSWLASARRTLEVYRAALHGFRP